MPSPSLSRAPGAPTPPSAKRCAVLIDGSALFLASASRIMDGRRLNYFALIELLTRQIQGLRAPGESADSIWTMWTSADPSNAGQSKFLEFAEQRLRWQVRASMPWQSFVIEPEALFGVNADAAKSGRLVRFDAPIAFAMGRLADTHQLIVVSDSFTLRESMLRVNEHWGTQHGSCVHAFFGQACDPRWRSVRKSDLDPVFVDLDEHQAELFGLESEEVKRPAAQPGQPIF